MNAKDLIKKKIVESEKKIQELLTTNDLKKVNDTQKNEIFEFYMQKSLNRLKTAKLIFEESLKGDAYTDFSEVVSAAYYAMYYIIHAFLALKYTVKLREGLRGVHALTLHLLVYYLIRTNRLAKYFYTEYCRTLNAAAEIQAFDPNDYQEEAFRYAIKYQQQRENRERFTYFISRNAAEHQAQHSIQVAEEFITTLRKLMKE